MHRVLYCTRVGEHGELHCCNRAIMTFLIAFFSPDFCKIVTVYSLTAPQFQYRYSTESYSYIHTPSVTLIQWNIVPEIDHLTPYHSHSLTCARAHTHTHVRVLEHSSTTTTPHSSTPPSLPFGCWINSTKPTEPISASSS